jgi:hypothetical protein
MRDLVAVLRQPVAQFGRIRRKQHLDGKPALGEEAFLLGNEERQVLNAGKYHYFQLRLGSGGTELPHKCAEEYRKANPLSHLPSSPH